MPSGDGPSSTIMSTSASSARWSARGRDAAAGGDDLRQEERAGREAEDLADEGLRRDPEGERLVVDGERVDGRRQPAGEPSAREAGVLEGHRAGPCPTRQPTPQRREAGRPVGCLAVPLQEQGQGPPLVEVHAPESRHRVGVQGARGQAVVGLGREPDGPPLRQARHRAMHDVTRIVGPRQVDPFRPWKGFAHGEGLPGDQGSGSAAGPGRDGLDPATTDPPGGLENATLRPSSIGGQPSPDPRSGRRRGAPVRRGT